MINGGSNCNVFWQVGSSATLGTTTAFADNILALANGCPGSRTYAVVIAATCPAITLSPTALPSPAVGIPYNQTVTASGGTAPYSYAVSNGALPAGLSLNTATGAITGTPTTVGTFNFTITSTDASGCTGSRAYTGTVTIAVDAQTAFIPTLSEWGLIILMMLTGLVGTHYLRRI